MASINMNKRKIDVVDLTGSDDEQDAEAHQRRSKQKQSCQWEPPTPPASSNQATSGPLSSQASSTRSAPLRRDPHASYSTPSQTVRSGWAETLPSSFDAAAEVEDSQGFDDNAYQSLALYGTVSTKVVGVRFYSGHATAGEFVVVRREPGNQYDANAIRIDNVMGQQIGHIPRIMAAKLAPFLVRPKRSLIQKGADKHW